MRPVEAGLYDGEWGHRRRSTRKMAGEAAIGVVPKAPLEEISEPIGSAKDHHVAEYRALIRGLEAARPRGVGDTGTRRR